MRSALFCSVLGLVLTLAMTESSSSKPTERTVEDKADGDAAAQPATSYSSVVYHDQPPQTHGDGGGGSSTRVTKAAALADVATAGAESSASFRLYHPKLEDYMSNMNPSLVQSLMKQQPQTFGKIEHHKSDSASAGAVAQAATKLLYPPKKYKSVVPGSQQTAFNVGYSIGFGGGGGGGGTDSGGRQPHPQALVGHEEVVTGKPKLRVRVEGKNSVWKQLSPNVEMSSPTNSPSSSSSSVHGRFSFDHDQALGQSNAFDVSNAVEDPLQLHQLPLAMPLTFPLPLSAFENVFIPPQNNHHLPLALAQTQSQPLPLPGHFRTGHSIQFKTSENTLPDAKPLGSLHSVHTLLPQDNIFNQAHSPLQGGDGLAVPTMQQVLVTGTDGQMVPAYLIPVAALGAHAPPRQRHPGPAFSTASFFSHPRPTASTSSTSSHPSGDSFDHHRQEHQQSNLVAAAASPHPDRLKPFRPSQPLGLNGFTVSTNPLTHSHVHPHPHSRQRSPYFTRSVVTDGAFKTLDTGDQRQVPSSMYVLRPPAPEKSTGSEPSFSYQMYEQPQSQSQSQHQPQPQSQTQAPPKFRTIVQLRPVQTGLLPGLRSSRDLVGEQTVLNAILSQELFRKNAAARNSPVIAQTVYGVRSYR